MNKHAQIGSTISWFFAVIAIFIILLIFLVFSGAIAAQKVSIMKVVGDKIVAILSSSEESYTTPYFDLRGAIVLLESPHGTETNRQYFSYSHLYSDKYVNHKTKQEDYFKCYTYSFRLLPGNKGQHTWWVLSDYAETSPDRNINLKLINFDRAKLANEREGFSEINFGAKNVC